MYSDIIQHLIKPFSRKKYDNHLRIHQDNAAPHYDMATSVLEEKGVQWVIF